MSRKFKRSQLDKAVTDLMELTGIEQRLRQSYPHELDGGRRQRVGIARGLALDPEFIICDEPVSALDVSIQAQILNLLMEIQKNRELSMMFITHDLSVVRHIADTIAVMYLGQIVEFGSTAELFSNQYHPYTKALLSAVPSLDIDNPSKRIVLHGELSSPINPKPGCRFYQRCPYCCDKCKEPQHLRELKPDYYVSCCMAEEVNKIR